MATDALWLLTSRRWTDPFPINVYVIEHRHGVVLFDTGQDRASVTEPNYFPGGLTGLLYKRATQFEIAPDDTITAQLATLGYSAEDVHIVVISHLHQDHIGGLRELHAAEILISRREWRNLSGPLPETRGLLRRHIQLPGLHWRQIAHEPTDDPALAPFTATHDIFGDGSLMLVPTPGHTPGSMSMLVRRPGQPPLMMVGDLTYNVHLLEHGRVPGLGRRRRLRVTTAMTNTIRDRHPDLVVLPAHDPGAAARLVAAGGESPGQ
jgi:glyoxylase-like metal-dependent hydrolase (beta-lactamase superfamily II)